LSMLRRYHSGERHVWRVVNVPSVEAEDQRHLPRDLETLKQERASTTNRLQGLLSSQGARLASVNKLPAQLDALRLWDGAPVPSGLRRRVLRVYAHYEFLGQQMAALAADRRALLRRAQEAKIEQVRSSCSSKASGSRGPGCW
jgi:transposase